MTDRADIKKDYLEFSRVQYFMAGAEDVNIASYGYEHKDSWFKKPSHTKGDRIDVNGMLQLKNSKAQQVASIELDEKTRIDLKGSAKGLVQLAHAPVKVTAAATGEHKKTETDQVRLVKLVMDMKTIADQLNAEKGTALVDLMKAGKYARIVNEVFVVVTAKMDATLSDSGTVSISASGPAGSGAVSVSASLDSSVTKEKSMSLTLGQGQILAYASLRFSEPFLKQYYDKDQEKPNSKFSPEKPPKFTAGDFTADHFND
jgi:hypothetical protein